jgi:hypothetical protein
MRMSTPVTSTTPRQIALRQGLLFGGSLGVLILIGAVSLVVLSAFHFSFSAVSVFPYALGLTYLLALIAFFFAGWRSAQRTGRVDIGALAGFWAGLVAALVGAMVYIVLIIASYGEYRYAMSSRSLAALIVSVVFTTTRNAILALLFGTGLGALGGFIGKIYASGPAAPPSVRPSAQPAQPEPPQAPPPSSP